LSSNSCEKLAITWYEWLKILLIVAISLAGWFRLFPIAGASDVRVHVRSAQVFFTAALDELDYPDWDSSAYGGRGTPMLRFIGPLPLILSSLLQLFGADAALSVKLTVLLFAFSGLLGLLKWLNYAGLGHGFVWTAFFMLLQPVVGFHLGVAFIFQNVCAYLVSPWLWFAAWKICRNDSRGLPIAAAAMGVMAWTHLYFVLMSGYAWEIIMICGWIKTRRKNYLLAAFLVPVAAFCLAAPYILPSVFTSNDVYYREVAAAFVPGNKYCEFLDEPAVDYDNRPLSFLSSLRLICGDYLHAEAQKINEAGTSILQIMSSPQRNNALRPWLLLTLVASLLLGLVGFAGIKRLGRNDSGFALSWLFAALFCAFMACSCSGAIYKYLPGASDVQFPFRWVLPAISVLIPLVAAAVAQNNVNAGREKIGGIIAALAKMLCLVVLGAGLALQFLYWPLPDASLKEFFAAPGSLQPFYPRSVKNIKKLPQHAAMPHQLMIVAGNGRIVATGHSTAGMTAVVEAASSLIVHINTHYDSFWRIKAAETGDIRLKCHEDDGTMLFNLPPGNWNVELYRVSPAGRCPGWLLMAVALLGLIWYHRRLTKQNDTVPDSV
jgi:hypothetical protein